MRPERLGLEEMHGQEQTADGTGPSELRSGGRGGCHRGQCVLLDRRDPGNPDCADPILHVDVAARLIRLLHDERFTQPVRDNWHSRCMAVAA